MPSTLPALDSHSSEYADCDSSYSDDTAPNVTLAFIGCPSSHTEISLDFETQDKITAYSSSEVFYECEQKRKSCHFRLEDAGSSEKHFLVDDTRPPLESLNDIDTDKILSKKDVEWDIEMTLKILRSELEAFSTETSVVVEDFNAVKDPQKTIEARQLLYNPLEQGDAPCPLCTTGRTSPFANDGKIRCRSPRKTSSHSKRNPSASPCETWQRKRSSERAGEGKISQRIRSGIRAYKNKTEGRHAEVVETGTLNFPIADQVEVECTAKKASPKPKARTLPKAQGDTEMMEKESKEQVEGHFDTVEVEADLAVAAASNPNSLPGTKQQSRGHPKIDKMFKDVLRILIEQSGHKSAPEVTSIYDNPAENKPFSFKSTAICSFGFQTETSKSNKACALIDTVVSDEESDGSEAEEPVSEIFETSNCAWPQPETRCIWDPNHISQQQDDIAHFNKNCHHCFDDDDEEEWERSDPEPSDSESCGDTDDSEDCKYESLSSPSREKLEICCQDFRLTTRKFQERVSSIAETSMSNTVREIYVGFQGGEGKAHGETEISEDDRLDRKTITRSIPLEQATFSRQRKDNSHKNAKLYDTDNNCEDSVVAANNSLKQGSQPYVDPGTSIGAEPGKSHVLREMSEEKMQSRKLQSRPLEEITNACHKTQMESIENLQEDNIEIIVTPPSPKHSTRVRENGGVLSEVTDSLKDGPSNLKVPWVSYAPLTQRPQRVPSDDPEQEAVEQVMDDMSEKMSLLEGLTDANDSKSFTVSPPFTDSQSKQGTLLVCLEKVRAVIKKVRARSVSPVKLFSKLNRFLSKEKEEVTPMKSLSELYDAGKSQEPSKMIIHKSRLVEFQTIVTRTQREERARVEESSPANDQQQPGDAHPPIFCLNVRNPISVKTSTMRIPRYDPFRTSKRTSIGEDTRMRNTCSPTLQGHRPIPVPGRVLESNALSCAVRGKLLAPTHNDLEHLHASSTEMEFQEYNHRRSAFRQYRENNGLSGPQAGALVVDQRGNTSEKSESEPTECVAQKASQQEEAPVSIPEFGDVEASFTSTKEQQCVVIEGIEGDRNIVIQGSLSWSDLRENDEVSAHDDVSSSAPIKTHSLCNVSETAHTESCVNDVMAILSQEVNIKRYPSFPDLTDLNDDDPGSVAGREVATTSSPLPDIEFDNDVIIQLEIDIDTSPRHIKTEQSPIPAGEVEMLKISQRRREATDKLSEEDGYEKLTPPNSPHLGAPSSRVQVQTMVSLLESCSVLCGEADTIMNRNASIVNATPYVHPDKIAKVFGSTVEVQQGVVIGNQPVLESEPTSFTSSSVNEQEMKIMFLPSPPSSSPSHSGCSQREIITDRLDEDLRYSESTSRTVVKQHLPPESCIDNLKSLRTALTLEYNMLAEETSSACGNINTLSEQRNLLDESDVSQLSQFFDTSEALPKVLSGTSTDGLLSLDAVIESKSVDIESREPFEAMPTPDTRRLIVPDSSVKTLIAETVNKPTGGNQFKVKTCTLQNESIFKKPEFPLGSDNELFMEEEESLSSSGKTSSPKCYLYPCENSTKEKLSSSAVNVFFYENGRLKLKVDHDQYPATTQHARSHSAERPSDFPTSEAVHSPILSRGENQRMPLRKITWSTQAYPEEESEQVSQSSSFLDRSEEFGILETSLKETKKESSLLESFSEHHPIVPSCEINGPLIEVNPRIVKTKNKTTRSSSMIDKGTKKKPANKSNLNNNVSMLSVFGLVPLRKIMNSKRNRSPMEHLSKINQVPVVVPDGVNLDPKSNMMKTSFVITPVSQIIGVSYAEEKLMGDKAFESESKEYQLDLIFPRSVQGHETKCLDEMDLLEKSRNEALKSRPCLYLLPQKAGTFASDPRKSNTKKSSEVQVSKTKQTNTKEKSSIVSGEIVAPPRVTCKVIAAYTDSTQPITSKIESQRNQKGSPEFSFSQPLAYSPHQYCLTTSYSLPLVVKENLNPLNHQQPRLGHGIRPSRTMTTLTRLSERIQRSEIQADKGYDFLERSHFHMERCEKVIRRSSEIIKNSQLMISSSKKRMEDTAKMMNLNCKRYFLC